ncbi:MAG: amidohydrolase, partial [Bacteroidota bacterium]
MRFTVLLFLGLSLNLVIAQPEVQKIDQQKQDAAQEVEKLAVLGQQVNDMLFSFSELGFQEYESFQYLTTLLEKNGFKVERGIAGMPTAWVARWSYGTGKPVIALGSDIDGIPKASQKPGVAYKDPIVEGAPGHGVGHNSGQAVNIISALALKKIMERDRISGT